MPWERNEIIKTTLDWGGLNKLPENSKIIFDNDGIFESLGITKPKVLSFQAFKIAVAFFEPNSFNSILGLFFCRLFKDIVLI